MSPFTPTIPLEQELGKQIYGALQGEIVEKILKSAKDGAGDEYWRSHMEGHCMKVDKAILPEFYALCQDVKRRLDFNEPKGDYMLFDAEKVEQCKNGKTQSVKIKNRDNRYSRYRATLLSCLAGDIENAALLNGAKYTCKQEGKKYICTITAEHASNKDVKQIELEYDVTTGKVLKIILTEGNGNYATYTTHNK